MKQAGKLDGQATLDVLPAWHPEPEKKKPSAALIPEGPEARQAHVRADACKLPGPSWNPDWFFEGVIMGADLIKEIPLIRFDVSNHFHENPETFLHSTALAR